jgi:hypothetical protein
MAEYDGGLNIWGKSVDDLMAVKIPVSILLNITKLMIAGFSK